MARDVLVGIVRPSGGLVHVWFFALESLLFARPTVFRRFGIRTAEDAAVVGPMAFNQGFYNLFLAVGVAGGVVLLAIGQVDAGSALALFACASMVGAALVLVATNRRFATRQPSRAGRRWWRSSRVFLGDLANASTPRRSPRSGPGRAS